LRVYRPFASIWKGRKGRSLTGNRLLLFCAVPCFASFGWGMVCHFQRPAKPTPAMMGTAVLAILFAIAQITALCLRSARFPLAALPLYAVGFTLFWWAVAVTRGKLAACGLSYISAEIVKQGPYRYIRHPFYAAYNLIWLAGFVATASWPLGVAAVIMAVVYDRFAHDEERGFLSSSLTSNYRKYMRGTGKYLPFILTRA
jgi:protein-S-isoprenylcysteine O-methyltransferase Ste14